MITNPNVKVNLGLNVLRKREDGFHDLETLFVPYHGISDVLEIVTGDDYSRTSASLFARYGAPSCPEAHDYDMPSPRGIQDDCVQSVAQGISDDGKLMITIARKEGVDWNPLADLCAKAYSVLAEDFDLPPVKIFLEKRSPVGAGLGGGSSDAAFTLKMLNEMFSLSLDESALAGYASRLGSDCAFFIYNRPMLGSGRGDLLEPYELKESIDFGENKDALYCLKVVVSENIYVSTADAYKDIVPGLPSVPLRDVLAMSLENWTGLLHNDFETTVFSRYPELKCIKDSLYASGAVYAAMSGSGSALFGIYKSHPSTASSRI